jgi:hypothetical protein
VKSSGGDLGPRIEDDVRRCNDERWRNSLSLTLGKLSTLPGSGMALQRNSAALPCRGEHRNLRGPQNASGVNAGAAAGHGEHGGPFLSDIPDKIVPPTISLRFGAYHVAGHQGT